MSNRNTDALQLGEKQIEDLPLDTGNAYNIPLPSITKGMKPTQVKARSYQCLVCTPILFFLLASILTGIQIYIVHSSNVEEFEAIKGVIGNILDSDCGAHPINGIKVVNSSEKCPEGYTPEPIGTFEGTIAGCYDTITTNLYPKPCAEKGGQFITAASIDAKLLFEWRGHAICTKRIQRIQYTQQEFSCPTATRQCSYYPYYICIDINDECPITDIRIQPTYKNVPRSYQTEQLGANYQIVYKNDPEIP